MNLVKLIKNNSDEYYANRSLYIVDPEQLAGAIKKKLLRGLRKKKTSSKNSLYDNAYAVGYTDVVNEMRRRVTE